LIEQLMPRYIPCPHYLIPGLTPWSRLKSAVPWADALEPTKVGGTGQVTEMNTKHSLMREPKAAMQGIVRMAAIFESAADATPAFEGPAPQL
jgi:hypothetical protein